MAKKKNNIYSMILQESIGYGTAGLISSNISSLTGDPTAMNAYRIGSGLAGVPSLTHASKKLMDAFKYL